MSQVPGLQQRFERHLRDAVLPSVRQRLDAYVDALQAAVRSMEDIAGGIRGATGTHDHGLDRTEHEAGRPADVAEARPDEVRIRLAYADRFRARFGEPAFAAARDARAALFEELTGSLGPLPELPLEARLPAEDSAPAAPELVRPARWRLLLAGARRGDARVVPVARLAAVFLAELDRRLEPVANDAARLMSVAVAVVRDELHRHAALEHGGAGSVPDLGREAEAVSARLERVTEGVVEEFGRALRADALRIPDEDTESARERTAARRAAMLGAWSEFETALMANVAAEAVLGTALATMEVTVADRAREVEALRAHLGAEPLDRLTDGMIRLGERAAEELEAGAGALGSLASEAGRLFATELPRIAALQPRLREQVEELVLELAAIPETVPDDLDISESPVPEIPERPRKLQIREAPLDALLGTACGGTLPRWLRKSEAAAGEELDAMAQELERVRRAVEFQLTAQLRGGVDDDIRSLATGLTERAAAQLRDLRAHGLTSVDALVTGLEERAAEETDALRSAVANRAFLRIHSEIAEEQAVRGIATGLGRARGAAEAVVRWGGRAWTWASGLVAVVRSWAQRQLGTVEIEREEMLESLEQSLIGEDHLVALPSMYRQLFDVEADVPWDELLVPRDEELAVIRRAFDRWVEDRSATVAIVGEKGSGKTTLVRLAEQQVFNESRVVRVGLGRTVDDPTELMDRLAASFELDGTAGVPDEINAQPPAVAIVEDLHHLFVRALGGFDALEAFLEVVSATADNVLWVVTVDEFAWRYLNRVVGIQAHFVHRLSTTNLAPDKLERAIMARHDVSGFALRFEMQAASQDGRLTRLLGRETKGELTRKESQRRRFFQDLAGIAEGNIVLALFYWLRSIRRVEEHVLVLGDPEIIDLEFLERIPLPHLHTIAAIILHGGLSHATHKRVFQLPAAESRLQLAALEDAHMVFLSRDGEFKINKVLYRPFIRLLVSKNVF